MKKSPIAPKRKEPIPIKYEMRGYNTLLGSHYDHYYLNYDYYDFSTPDDEVFQVERSNNNIKFLLIAEQNQLNKKKSFLTSLIV